MTSASLFQRIDANIDSNKPGNNMVKIEVLVHGVSIIDIRYTVSRISILHTFLVVNP